MSAVIPDFRIDDSVIEKDAALLEKLGVKVFYGREVTSVKELQEEYDAVILAVGAYKRGQLKLDGKEVRNALEFLEEINRAKGTVNLGKHVVVIGGGNTAMDTARAAKRCAGVEHVYLAYRRTKRYMPADEHELLLAIEDGVEFKELLAPDRMEEGRLICKVTRLGEPDGSGRASVIVTDQTEEIRGAFLIGEMEDKEHPDYIYITGAIQMYELKRDGNTFQITEETWKNAYEDLQALFWKCNDRRIGLVSCPGIPAEINDEVIRTHENAFPNTYSIFVMRDLREKEDYFYVNKFNDLMKVSGYYIYYEKILRCRII